MVSDLRYLGAHQNVSGRTRATTNLVRLKGGVIQCGKLKRLPIEKREKAKTIRTKKYPGALYGAEAVQIPDRQIAKLATAVIKVVTISGTHHDVDSTFAAC